MNVGLYDLRILYFLKYQNKNSYGNIFLPENSKVTFGAF